MCDSDRDRISEVGEDVRLQSSVPAGYSGQVATGRYNMFKKEYKVSYCEGDVGRSGLGAAREVRSTM